jgi:hypothetical protein
MGAARQILRYSIPGSIVLLHGIACFLIYRRIQGVSFAASSMVLDESIGALVAILAAIPIGFVVYQAYYFSYSPLIRLWPQPWKGRLIRPDRGSEILATLEQPQLDALGAIFESHPLDVSKSNQPVQEPEGGKGRIVHWFMVRLGVQELTPNWHESILEDERRGRAYSTRWHANWNVVRAILDIASSTKGGRQIKEEYTTLSDIYHALGAARTAFLFSFFGVTVLAAFSYERFFDHPFRSLVGLVVIFVLTAGFYVILHMARVRTWQTASATLQLGFRWFFWVHVDSLVGETRKGKSPDESWLKSALRSRMPPKP